MKLLLLCLFTAVLACAQSITGAISGTVTDPTSAAIAGASLRLTSSATGAERTGSTNEAGRFYFGSLQPGPYTLAVEAAGFRRLERTSINVSAAETLTISDLQLEIGQVTDSVQVRAQVATLQTETAERAGVLTTSQVQNLAIRGRNVTSLVSLLPGSSISTTRKTSPSTGTSTCKATAATPTTSPSTAPPSTPSATISTPSSPSPWTPSLK